MAPGAPAKPSAVAACLVALCMVCVGSAKIADAGLQESDTTVFLQGELVQAKNEEQAKKRQVDEAKPQSTFSPACAASGKDGSGVCQSCGDGDTIEVSSTSDEELPIHFSEKIEPELPTVVALAEGLAGGPEDSMKVDAELPSLILRRFLIFLIFLLFVDGVKRWFQQGTSFSQPKETYVPLASTGEVRTAAQKAAADSFMRTALLGHAIEAEALLEDVFSVDEVDVWGSSFLHAAAKGGSARLVKLLLQYGAKVDQLDAWDETPLHLAARGGFTEACELLLDAGAALEARNMQGRAALEIAAIECNQQTCELLSARGATAPEQDVPAFLQELLNDDTIDQSVAAPRQTEACMDEEEEDIRDYGRDGFEGNLFAYE